jgi:hypothetical protein
MHFGKGLAVVVIIPVEAIAKGGQFLSGLEQKIGDFSIDNWKLNFFFLGLNVTVFIPFIGVRLMGNIFNFIIFNWLVNGEG